MIQPTVGRVVWVYPSNNSAGPKYFHVNDGNQPCAAIVTYVWGDRMVNLSVLDHNGEQHSRTSVPLIQDGDYRPENGYFCEWMPYQVGQAKRHEAEARA